MKTLREQINAYKPYTVEEAQAKKEILNQWDIMGDAIFARPDTGHFTVSSIILNISFLTLGNLAKSYKLFL